MIGTDTPKVKFGVNANEASLLHVSLIPVTLDPDPDIFTFLVPPGDVKLPAEEFSRRPDSSLFSVAETLTPTLRE